MWGKKINMTVNSQKPFQKLIHLLLTLLGTKYQSTMPESGESHSDWGSVPWHNTGRPIVAHASVTAAGFFQQHVFVFSSKTCLYGRPPPFALVYKETFIFCVHQLWLSKMNHSCDCVTFQLGIPLKRLSPALSIPGASGLFFRIILSTETVVFLKPEQSPPSAGKRGRASLPLLLRRTAVAVEELSHSEDSSCSSCEQTRRWKKPFTGIEFY